MRAAYYTGPAVLDVARFVVLLQFFLLVVLPEVQCFVWMDLESNRQHEIMVRNLAIIVLVKVLEDFVGLFVIDLKSKLVYKRYQFCLLDVSTVLNVEVFKCFTDS